MLHKYIQHFWHPPSRSSGWMRMRKHAFMSIFVVGHQRIILTTILPIAHSSYIIYKRLHITGAMCEFWSATLEDTVWCDYTKYDHMDLQICVISPLTLKLPGQFLAATKQLNEWYFPSVRLSVRQSVRLSVTPIWLCSHHQIIMKFSRVITNDKSDIHAKGQGQRSKVKVTEVMTPFSRFRTVTSVWIHILRWNYAYSLMLLRKGALLFFKVIRQISRSRGSKNRPIWPRLGVSGL